MYVLGKCQSRLELKLTFQYQTVGIMELEYWVAAIFIYAFQCCILHVAVVLLPTPVVYATLEKGMFLDIINIQVFHPCDNLDDKTVSASAN